MGDKQVTPMNPEQLKRMMGHLKYTASVNTKGKADKEEKKEMAQKCLKAWDDMGPIEKREFMAKFEECGGSKGRDTLKFCLEYSLKVEREKSIAMAWTENFYTRRAGSQGTLPVWTP